MDWKIQTPCLLFSSDGRKLFFFVHLKGQWFQLKFKDPQWISSISEARIGQPSWEWLFDQTGRYENQERQHGPGLIGLAGRHQHSRNQSSIKEYTLHSMFRFLIGMRSFQVLWKPSQGGRHRLLSVGETVDRRKTGRMRSFSGELYFRVEVLKALVKCTKGRTKLNHLRSSWNIYHGLRSSWSSTHCSPRLRSVLIPWYQQQIFQKRLLFWCLQVCTAQTRIQRDWLRPPDIMQIVPILDDFEKAFTVSLSCKGTKSDCHSQGGACSLHNVSHTEGTKYCLGNVCSEIYQKMSSNFWGENYIGHSCEIPLVRMNKTKFQFELAWHQEGGSAENERILL